MSDSATLAGTLIPMALAIAAEIVTGFRVVAAYSDRDAERLAEKHGKLTAAQIPRARKIVADGIRREWIRVGICAMASAAIILSHRFVFHYAEVRNWAFAAIAALLASNSVLDHFSQRWFLGQLNNKQGKNL